jgi:acyl carrier protein
MNEKPEGSIDTLREILRDALQLGARADELESSSALLGAVPEFDSMAVVTVLTMIEEEFGFAVEDDEITAETFKTVGTLAAFISRKVSA